MTRKNISEAISNISNRHIEEAAGFRKRAPQWTRWGVVAACLCLMIAASSLWITREGLGTQGNKAKVTYGEHNIPSYTSKGELVYFSEEELFERENMYAFRGKVVELQNITINFDGFKEYRCVAVLDIEKVYQGEITVGEQIRMLLPCPITKDIKQEDTGVIAGIKVGMEGIFMPWVFDENSYIEMNGKIFDKSEVASCGLADGMRWAFLASEYGVVFEKNAYKGAVGAATLDDIEAYVIEMLQ